MRLFVCLCACVCRYLLCVCVCVRVFVCLRAKCFIRSVLDDMLVMCFFQGIQGKFIINFKSHFYSQFVIQQNQKC